MYCARITCVFLQIVFHLPSPLKVYGSKHIDFKVTKTPDVRTEKDA
jgi:hypothetical protein